MKVSGRESEGMEVETGEKATRVLRFQKWKFWERQDQGQGLEGSG